MPPTGTEWLGVTVFVAPDGVFGHGPLSLRLVQSASLGKEHGHRPIAVL